MDTSQSPDQLPVFEESKYTGTNYDISTVRASAAGQEFVTPNKINPIPFRGSSKSPADQRKNDNSLIVARSVSPPKAGTRQLSPGQIDESKSDNDRRKEIANFDPSDYVFKKPDFNFKQERFIEKFSEHSKANRSKINQQIVEQTYLQILKRFKSNDDSERDSLENFKENKLQWAGLMMKSKKLQQMFSDFTEQVSKIVESEFLTNRKFINEWVKYPHRSNQKMQKPQPYDQLQMSSDEDALPIYYPNNPLPNPKAQTVFNKTKQHLRKLAVQVKEKKMQEQMSSASKRSSPNKSPRTQRSPLHQGLNLDPIPLELGDSPGLNQSNAESPALRQKSKRQNTISPKRHRTINTSPKKNLLTPIQELLAGHLSQVDEKIASLCENTDQFGEEVNEIENQMRQANNDRQGRMPGTALQNMLQKWSEERVYTASELRQYANELAKSLKEYEADMKKQQWTQEIELRDSKAQFMTRIDGVRQQAAMRIEALESALIEVKLKYKRELDRAEMEKSEMESYLLNSQANADSETQYIQQQLKTLSNYDGHPEMKLERVERLCQTLQDKLKKQQIQVDSLMQKNRELQFQVDQNTGIAEKAAADAIKEKSFVLYYQNILIDILKQTGIYEKVGGDFDILHDDVVMFIEIVQTNEERLVSNESDKAAGKLNKRTQFNRISKYVTNTHKLIKAMEVQRVMKEYQTLMQSRNEKFVQLAKDLVNMGVISEKVLTEEGIKLTPEDKANIDMQSDTFRGSKLDLVRKQNQSLERSQSTDMRPAQASPRRSVMGGNSVFTVQPIATVQEEPEKENNSKDASKKESTKSVVKTPSLQKTKSTPRSPPKRRESIAIKPAGRKGSKGPKKSTTSVADDASEEMVIDPLTLARSPGIQRRGGITKDMFDTQIHTAVTDNLRKLVRDFPQEVKKNISSVRGEELLIQKQDSVEGDDDFGSVEGLGGLKIQVGTLKKKETKPQESGRFDDVMEKDFGKSSLRDVTEEAKHKKEMLIEELEQKQGARAQEKAAQEAAAAKAAAAEAAKAARLAKKAKKGAKKPSSPVKKIEVVEQVKPEVKVDETSDIESIKSDSVSVSSSKKSKKQLKTDESSRKLGSKSQPPLNRRADSKTSKSKKQLSSLKLPSHEKRDRTAVSLQKSKQPSSQKVMQTTEKKKAELEEDFKSEAKTEPLEVIQQALEDFEQKVQLKYSAELEAIALEETGDAKARDLKIKGGQFNDIYRMFEMSIGQKLGDGDYMNLFQTSSKFDEFIKQLNNIQVRCLRQSAPATDVSSQFLQGAQKKKKIDWGRKIPLSDCVVSEIDQDGNFNGFTIRSKLAKILMWRGGTNDMKLLTQLIKTVNYLNRLLHDNQNDFELKERNVDPNLGKPTKVDFGCQYDQPEEEPPKPPTPEPEPIESESEKEEGPSKEYKEFFDLIQDHAADILERGKDRRAYYKMIFGKKDLDGMLQYPMMNVFDSVPEDGFDDENNPKPIKTTTFLDYLKTVFGLITEKMKTRIPRDRLKELSIHDLVFVGDIPDDYVQPEPKEKPVSDSGPKKKMAHKMSGTQTYKQFSNELEATMKESLEEELTYKVTQQLTPEITEKVRKQFEKNRPMPNLKQESQYAQSKIKTKKNHVAVNTGLDLLDEFIGEKIRESQAAKFDMKNKIQIDKAITEEMGALIDGMNDFMERCTVKNEVDKHSKSNMDTITGARNSLTTNDNSSVMTQDSMMQAIRKLRSNITDQSINIQDELEDAVNNQNKGELEKQLKAQLNQTQKSKTKQQNTQQALPNLETENSSRRGSNMTNMTSQMKAKNLKLNLGNNSMMIEQGNSFNSRAQVTVRTPSHQNPFKHMTTIKKGQINQQSGEPERPVSGRNPPGLTATKLDYKSSGLMPPLNNSVMDQMVYQETFNSRGGIATKKEANRSNNFFSTDVSSLGGRDSNQTGIRVQMDKLIPQNYLARSKTRDAQGKITMRGNRGSTFDTNPQYFNSSRVSMDNNDQQLLVFTRRQNNPKAMAIMNATRLKNTRGTAMTLEAHGPPINQMISGNFDMNSQDVIFGGAHKPEIGISRNSSNSFGNYQTAQKPHTTIRVQNLEQQSRSLLMSPPRKQSTDLAQQKQKIGLTTPISRVTETQNYGNK